MQIYGYEWTIKYPMEQPDGSVIDTKISIPKTVLFNLPYMAGRWSCQMMRTDSKIHYSTELWMNCVIKGGTRDGPVALQQVVRCNHKTRGELKGLDIKDNYVKLRLPNKTLINPNPKILSTVLEIWCKL